MMVFCTLLTTYAVARAVDSTWPQTRPSPATRAGEGGPGIERRPPAATWRLPRPRSLSSSKPSLEADKPFSLDLRHADATGLNAREHLAELLLASFDEGTRWPAASELPEGYEPMHILNVGKSPGLGVRELHRRGLTGKGVSIAVIDQPLLTEHVEYANRLKHYEEIPPLKSGGIVARLSGGGEGQASMHGCAVASIAAGRTVGVAPGSDLYFIAARLAGKEWGKRDFTCAAQAVDRILELNRQLPPESRIRVISLSVGWDPGEQGYEAMQRAALRAKEAGMLVICSSVENVHGFKFHGLGRTPTADPENAASYGPGLWWAGMVERAPDRFGADRLLVPMDSRTTASPHGPNEYVFYRNGGWSWSIPWIAGLYALALEANPTLTPERFWDAAMHTGDFVEIRVAGQPVRFGPIANPVRLIESLGRTGTAHKEG